MTSGRYRLSDTFWDLRDDAFDHPEGWEGVRPESVFQRLGELVEAAEDRQEPIDWRRDVVERMIAWRGDAKA